MVRRSGIVLMRSKTVRWKNKLWVKRSVVVHHGVWETISWWFRACASAIWILLRVFQFDSCVENFRAAVSTCSSFSLILLSRGPYQQRNFQNVRLANTWSGQKRVLPEAAEDQEQRRDGRTCWELIHILNCGSNLELPEHNWKKDQTGSYTDRFCTKLQASKTAEGKGTAEQINRSDIE